jgi:hypothetical protein
MRLCFFNHTGISERLIFEDATRSLNFSNSEFFAEKVVPFCLKNNTMQVIPSRLFPSMNGWLLTSDPIGAAAFSNMSGPRNGRFQQPKIPKAMLATSFT